jgi:hypothetical protein
MAIVYPGGIDSFSEPSLPEITPLSEAGTGTRNHVEHHHDLGRAIIALEQNASWKSHDHSGGGSTANGNKLAQANTHEAADTNASPSSLHHTLAVRNYADLGIADANIPANGWKAAAANHVHDYNGPSILNQPFLLCTSTTRPLNPPIGTMIYERDSNVVRVWARVNQQNGPVDFLNPEGKGGLVPWQDDDNYKWTEYSPTWQILPVARVPIFRAEATGVQEVQRVVNTTVRFVRVLQDFIWDRRGTARFQVRDVNTGIITVPEPGLYDLRAIVHWDPNRTFHDFSYLLVTVNGQEINRTISQYSRAPVFPWGDTSLPGQPQTLQLSFAYRFSAGDEIQIQVFHNAANRASFLWHNNIGSNKQAATIEIIFRAP